MMELSFMRRFYFAYSKLQTVSEKLRWSHYFGTTA
ncbi:MAG TPA: hypothetical protein IAA76_08530 [Candidatus Ornithospirochaeta stercorigallinarum]|nr:hypothetical protein [Candidatus Ornithospirochaeta stercorigallinarum]